MPVTETAKVRVTGAGLITGFNVPTMNSAGALLTMDFFMAAILDGRGYQAKAGTITAPLVGDVAITDATAEIAVDAILGEVIIPVFQNIATALATGTLFEYATKSAATVSSSGTAFVLLPMLSSGPAATITARVDPAGGVAVTAELATTTLRHWSFAGPLAEVANGGNTIAELNWEPLRPPVLVGPRSLYTQIAATGTGPSYFANLDVLQFTTGQLGL